MVRVDVWDIPRADADDVIMLNLPQTFHDTYILGDELGRGGFGVVKIATDRFTGQQLACKIIQKRLSVPNLAAAKQAQHLDKITREIEVLRRLRSSLNVAQLRGAFEDITCVYITMEWCTGGELWHRIGRAHYSEQTASSYMRAVLRTVAQCHNNRILHRDIKPGNFMLLSDSPKAPIKAIDFGLAVFYTEKELPRTDLGLEGTPWFMAPEVLECSVGPPADVWAAGVMAYQLLSGYLPFDDRGNPRAPAVSKIWQAIFGQEPKMKGGAWANISEDAKDFVKALLNKDPNKRPTAREALKHAWLRGSAADRTHGKALDRTVVQRIQHFSQGNVLRKTIFELIAGELLKAADVQPGSEMQRKCSGSGQSMQHFREALSRQITPDDSLHGIPQERRYQGASSEGVGVIAAAAAPLADAADGPAASASCSGGNSGSECIRGRVSFAIDEGSGPSRRSCVSSSGWAHQPPLTGGEGPLEGTSHSRAVRSMSTGALDTLLASRPHDDDDDGSSAGGEDNIDRNRRMFEDDPWATHWTAARERADLGATAGGSAHAGMQFYGAIQDYDGAHTSVGRSFPGARPQRVGCKRPNTVHGGRSYFGGPALGPLAGNSRYRLMRAAAAAGRLPGRGFETSDYVHLAPRTASERYEQRKAARLSLDTSFARASTRPASSTGGLSSIAASEDGASMDVDDMSIMPSATSSHGQRHQLSLELERQQRQQQARGHQQEKQHSSSGGGSGGELRLPAVTSSDDRQSDELVGTQGGRSQGLYKAYVEGGAPQGSGLASLDVGYPAGGRIEDRDSPTSMDFDHDEVEAMLETHAKTSVCSTPTTSGRLGSSQNAFLAAIAAARGQAVRKSDTSSKPDLQRPGSAPDATATSFTDALIAPVGDTPMPRDVDSNSDVASTSASARKALAEVASWRRGGLGGSQDQDGLGRLQQVSMEGRPPRRSPTMEARSGPPRSPLASQPSTPRAPPYATTAPFVPSDSREGSGSGRGGFRSGMVLGMRRSGSAPKVSSQGTPETEELRHQEGVSRTIELLGRRSLEAPPSSPDALATAPGWPDTSGTLPGEKPGTGEAVRQASLSRDGSQKHLEGSRHGGSRRGSGSGSFALAAATEALQGSTGSTPPQVSQGDSQPEPKTSAFAEQSAQQASREGSGSGSRRGPDRHVRFGGATEVSHNSPLDDERAAESRVIAADVAAPRSRVVQGDAGPLEVPLQDEITGGGLPLRDGHYAVPREVHELMHRLQFSPEEEGVAAERLAEGLQRLGYALEEGEAERLLETAAGTTSVPKAKFLASQIDWGSYQMNFREQWLLAAKRAFDAIEGAASSLPGGGSGNRGALNSKDLIDLLRARLPWAEVDYAVEDALLEAGAVDADEIDFEGFLRLMRVESEAQLDQYESRHHGGSSLNGGGGSHHGGSSG